MAFAKFEGNRFSIDGKIAENYAILVDHLTWGITRSISSSKGRKIFILLRYEK